MFISNLQAWSNYSDLGCSMNEVDARGAAASCVLAGRERQPTDWTNLVHSVVPKFGRHFIRTYTTCNPLHYSHGDLSSFISTNIVL